MACLISTQQFPPLLGCCVQCARHQYLGPKIVELLQCGLPAVDAFKVGRSWGKEGTGGVLQRRRVQLCACRHTLQLCAMTALSEARSLYAMASTQPHARQQQRQQRHDRALPLKHLPPYFPALCRWATSWYRTRLPWQPLVMAAAPCSCSQRFGCATTAAGFADGVTADFFEGFMLLHGSIFSLQACYCTPAHADSVLSATQAADARSREMLRDIVCYTSKTLQGQFGQLAVRAGSWCRGLAGHERCAWAGKRVAAASAGCCPTPNSPHLMMKRSTALPWCHPAVAGQGREWRAGPGARPARLLAGAAGR